MNSHYAYIHSSMILIALTWTYYNSQVHGDVIRNMYNKLSLCYPLIKHGVEILTDNRSAGISMQRRHFVYHTAYNYFRPCHMHPSHCRYTIFLYIVTADEDVAWLWYRSAKEQSFSINMRYNDELSRRHNCNHKIHTIRTHQDIQRKPLFHDLTVNNGKGLIFTIWWWQDYEVKYFTVTKKGNGLPEKRCPIYCIYNIQ